MPRDAQLQETLGLYGRTASCGQKGAHVRRMYFRRSQMSSSDSFRRQQKSGPPPMYIAFAVFAMSFCQAICNTLSNDITLYTASGV